MKEETIENLKAKIEDLNEEIQDRIADLLAKDKEIEQLQDQNNILENVGNLDIEDQYTPEQIEEAFFKQISFNNHSLINSMKMEWFFDHVQEISLEQLEALLIP